MVLMPGGWKMTMSSLVRNDSLCFLAHCPLSSSYNLEFVFHVGLASSIILIVELNPHNGIKMPP